MAVDTARAASGSRRPGPVSKCRMLASPEAILSFATTIAAPEDTAAT